MRELFTTFMPDSLILDTPEDLAFYGRDSCRDFTGAPRLVILPESISQLSKALAICDTHRLPVVPSGGRTGYSGGATAPAGEIVLSLSRMNKILSFNRLDGTLTCEAGVTTERVRDAAAKEGLQYPVDFASRGSSHIGGNIATNAGGIRVIRYGNTREWVLGLRVVLADGEILDLNGSLVKNQTGLDLRHLFIGSEGTLGVIAEATLRLTKQCASSSLACVACNSLKEVTSLLEILRDSDLVLNVFEFFEWNALEKVIAHTGLPDPFSERHQAYAIIEVENTSPETSEDFQLLLGNALERGTARDAVLAASSKQAGDLMALRERISETLGQLFLVHKNDLSVPPSSVPAFVEDLRALLGKLAPEFELVCFGHVGDGNIHVNVLKPSDLTSERFFERCRYLDEHVFELTSRFSGSISAEHGVGLLKRPYLHFSRSAREISLMKQIKESFDPHGILNPNKVFP